MRTRNVPSTPVSTVTAFPVKAAGLHAPNVSAVWKPISTVTPSGPTSIVGAVKAISFTFSSSFAASYPLPMTSPDATASRIAPNAAPSPTSKEIVAPCRLTRGNTPSVRNTANAPASPATVTVPESP